MAISGHDLLLLCGLALPGALLLIVFQVFITFVQKRYIVKRYEEETGLSKTDFFKNPVFSYFSHPSWKPGFYTFHLFAVIVLSQRVLKRSPGFRTSPSRKEMLAHFSKKELAYTFITVASALVAILLFLALFILNHFGPNSS